jgi:hypothetical protein
MTGYAAQQAPDHRSFRALEWRVEIAVARGGTVRSSVEAEALYDRFIGAGLEKEAAARTCWEIE